jgi:SHS2 domain-containing protein
VTGSFSLRSHTADVAVEATGDSLGAVFAAVADGLAAAMCDDVPDSGGERFDVTASADALDDLLYDYLGELIYERDVRGVLPDDNDVEIGSSEPDDGDGDEATAGASSYSLTASARGVPLDAVDAREVKAVTYSEMRVERRGDEWYAYVVFDV